VAAKLTDAIWEQRERLWRAAQLDKAIQKHEARLRKHEAQLHEHEERLKVLAADLAQVTRDERTWRAHQPRPEPDTWRSNSTESVAHIERAETIPFLRDLIATSFADLVLFQDDDWDDLASAAFNNSLYRALRRRKQWTGVKETP
jgi:hypothetical protein